MKSTEQTVNLAMALVCLIVLGCGGKPMPPSTQPPSAQESTEDKNAKQKEQEQANVRAIEEAIAREIAPLGTAQVNGPDNQWIGTIESAGEPAVTTTEDNNIIMSIPIGAQSPVTCSVYSKEIDIGNAVGNMFEAAKKAVKFQQIMPVAAEVAGSSAMIAATGVYAVNIEGQTQMGMFKIAAYDHPLFATICIHDEVGYTKSFLRIVKGFFASFKAAVKEETPLSVEVWTAGIREKPVGFSKTVIIKNKDNSRTSKSKTVFMIPRTPVDLMISVQRATIKSNAKGRIVYKESTSSMANETDLNIVLQRGKKGDYTYKGESKGKPIEGTFTVKDKQGLWDEWSITKRVKQLIGKSKDETFTLETYSAETDPTKAIETKYEVFGTKTPAEVLMSIGQVGAKVIADEKGYPIKMTIPMGAFEMQMQREYQAGEI